MREEPGDFGTRLARAERLGAETASGVAREPLAVLAAVLRHQQGRARSELAAELTAGEPGRQQGHDRYPLLDLGSLAPTVAHEVRLAVASLVEAVPAPLGEAGHRLVALAPSELAAVVDTWFDDVALVEPRLAFWLQVAAGPVLELRAGHLTVPDDWKGAACPVCGGTPQASVIAERSGEFMAGSPRSLVCSRCATWWPFARATCVSCGEADPRNIESYLVDGQRWARVDTCSTCSGYIKTFDLREPEAKHVVPLVDDLASLNLDVWAQERGFARTALSLAGV